MLMFKKRLRVAEEGFTLVEVLVAILITSVFVFVAMQGIVIAAFLKASAQQSTEATTWIQQDLEYVKYQAENFQLPRTTLMADTATGASSINVALVTNLVANDTLKVGVDPGTYKITAINVTTNTLTITPTLGTDQSQNAAVLKTTICNTGLANALRDQITGISQNGATTSFDSSKTSIRTNRTFTVRRTTTLLSLTTSRLCSLIALTLG